SRSANCASDGAAALAREKLGLRGACGNRWRFCSQNFASSASVLVPLAGADGVAVSSSIRVSLGLIPRFPVVGPAFFVEPRRWHFCELASPLIAGGVLGGRFNERCGGSFFQSGLPPGECIFAVFLPLPRKDFPEPTKLRIV